MSSTATRRTKVLAWVVLMSSLQGLVAALSPADTLRSFLDGNLYPSGGNLPTDVSPSEWTYRRTGNDGKEPYSPSDWHLGYPECGGDSQSPINLSVGVESAVEAREFHLEFYGTECTVDQLNFTANEDHWLVDFEMCDDIPHLNFDGEAYELLQLHFHSPSEHMIGGSCHDAEIHLVHRHEDWNTGNSDLLVVGVFLDAREYGSNVEIEPLWDVLKTGAASTTDTRPTRVYDLLPAETTYSHYVGSLTTPPCTEGVKWIVMSSPTVIGRMQLDECRTSIAVFHNSKVDERSNTNRPCQSIHGRTVYIV